jgi:hypothetical protein
MIRLSIKSLVLLALPLVATCNPNRTIGGEDEVLDGGTEESGDLRRPPCTSLACRVSSCRDGGKTTLSGVVNIPAGNLPLENVSVYVPNSALDDIPTGASCNRCDAPLSGNPIVKTVTDASGRFRLEGAPDGADVPLVIQLGKWRRQVTLPPVTPCTDNAVSAELTRLPREKAEGNIPRIALATGGADALECLLHKFGIADSEFTPEGGSGRVNLYSGQGGTARYDAALNGGAAFSSATSLWDSLDTLKKYDVVLLSCEGSPTLTNKSAAARQALYEYLKIGGRAFGSHYHWVWIRQGPAPMPTVAQWGPDGSLGAITADIDTSFARGAAMADWLLNVGASTQRGKLPLSTTGSNIASVTAGQAQRWIYYPPSNVLYFSFNAPIGADEKTQCGRMVDTDIHVASGDRSSSGLAFPSGGCKSTTLLPEEKALIYLLFDLSNCLETIPIPG